MVFKSIWLSKWLAKMTKVKKDYLKTMTTEFIKRDGKPDIAYQLLAGKGPTLVWLGGFASDMAGTKASFLHDWCAANGQAFVRFDYSGHGQSGGVFEEGAISDWAADALTVIDQLTQGALILIGSSMGGWISCLLAKQRAERLAGIVLIAPAVDFTKELMWPSLSAADQATILRDGKLVVPSDHDDSAFIYTRRLFDDGVQNLVFTEALKIPVPVHILQGMRDEPVPWQHAVRVAAHIEAPEVTITLSKQGDHRLSSGPDLERLVQVLAGMVD